ncbi:sugar ABC transporter substrate-binding protein [Cohnella candidum]|uniref:Extracellular solute-binding protein n=1 Tax=Cohnella candidum TaxID=2674991 RepID=A0A3G3K3C1_9BACL|nr:extracellular solute-binding protein [Cohnella candidum]AYQ74958.1 extracellular solute-binding protein [Cohnella candidum]
MRFKRASIFLIAIIVAAYALSVLYSKTTALPSEVSESAAPAVQKRPASLKVMVDNVYQPYIEKISTEFEREYGIKVEVLAAPSDDLHDEIVKRVDTEVSDIDLIQVKSEWTREFAASGFLEPLNKFVTTELKGNTIPLAYDQRVLSNELYTLPELYAFPMSMEAHFLFYNQDLLCKVGLYAPPSTWKELMDAVTFMREKNLVEHGVIWGWNDSEGLMDDYTLLLNAMGGQYKDVNGKWIFNRGAGLKALQFMVDSLYDNQLTDPLSIRVNESKASEEFAKGRVPFLIAGSYAALKLKDYSNIKVALIPGFDKSLKSSSVAGGSAIGLVRNSRNKDWGWKFIQMMSEKRNDVIVTDYTGGLPVWNDMIDLATLRQTYPSIDIMKEQFEYAINQPLTASYHSWARDLQASLMFALQQKNTPQDALNQAVRRAQKDLID